MVLIKSGLYMGNTVPSCGTETYDPAERAREKQASREQDERDLASGAKTREQLHRENAAFAGLKVRIDFSKAKKLA